MTKDEAEKLGYKVMAASPFEVGLVKNDTGIMTWWSQDFDLKMPPLDHPKILEAIQRTENMLKGIWT